MTKKDFELVADTLATLREPSGLITMPESERHKIAFALAGAFRANYPSFDSVKFLNAAGIF